MLNYLMSGAESKFQPIDSNTSSSESKKLLSYIMSIAGDCRLMMGHATSNEEIEKYREQYQVLDDVDRQIQTVISEVGINDSDSGKTKMVVNSSGKKTKI